MSGDRVAVQAYRSLTRLYPRAFRLEYRDDLIQLFSDQCRDERVPRVVARAALDLVITLPTEHVEAHMNRTSNATVPVLFAALAVAGLLLAGLAGTEPVPLIIGLCVAVGASALAVVSWRRAGPVATATPSIVRRWWTFIGIGVALLAIGGLQNQFEFGNWYVWILMVLSAVVAVVIGLVLGLVQLLTHHRSPSAL